MNVWAKSFSIFIVAVAWLFSAPLAVAEEESILDRIRERGVLEVAVYADFPPFSYRDERGRVVGIDVDIAKALAQRLGVAAAIRAVGADESMEDDLRNNVWKGHYLGGGVADVMLHVPQHTEFAEENDRVIFIAPYYQDSVAIAVRAGDGPLDPLERFSREKVGVELDTLADFFMLTAYEGRLRNQVVHFRTIEAAVTALVDGELAGVVGPRSEIEFALGDRRAHYSVAPAPIPGLSDRGWTLGAAVKQGNDQLAEAIGRYMKELRDGGELEKIFRNYRSTYQMPQRSSQRIAESNEQLAQQSQ